MTSKKSKKKTQIEVKLDHAKIPRGHQDHKTGNGPHKDKRTKRNRTRSDRERKALEDD